MKRYIDAEKLKAEIERYKQGAAIARFDNAGENADYFQGKVDLCDDLTHIITSLQQEQSQITNTSNDTSRQKIKGMVDSFRQVIFIAESYGNSYIIWDTKSKKTAIDLLEKATGYLRSNSDVAKKEDNFQQEQPEVELEKEIQEHIKECLDIKFPTTDIEQIKKDVAYTARKFYKLGLNARKENENESRNKIQPW